MSYNWPHDKLPNLSASRTIAELGYLLPKQAESRDKLGKQKDTTRSARMIMSFAALSNSFTSLGVLAGWFDTSV